jgi:hypothetical protein
MLKPRVHVCLLYNTATANITPALDPSFRPEEVVLVHGFRQNFRADCIESVLKNYGITVTRWKLDRIFDSEHVRERMLQLTAERSDDDIALNASGGTRPMLVGAFEVFQKLQKPVFYVHPESDLISWLHRRDLPSFNCAHHIKLPDFLCTHGATLIGMAPPDGIPRNLRLLTEELIGEMDRISLALATVNWLAKSADNAELVSPGLDDRQLSWNELRRILDRFAEEDLLTIHGRQIRFRDEAARFYVNGGWLEQHVFGLLFGLRKELPAIHDLARSVAFERRESGKSIQNELDVMFIANNRCYIIECKTKRFSAQEQNRLEPDSPGTDTLYKLDTLKRLVGETRSRAMLISYRDLPRHDLERARDLGIAVCTGRQLASLENRLRSWITTEGRPY